MNSKIKKILNSSKITKKLFIVASLLFSAFGFSQSHLVNGVLVEETPILENVSITVTVDSSDEIESTFNVEDIKRIIDDSKDNETVSFKIICNGKEMSNGEKSHVSYKIEGNSNKKESFLKGVEKIRTSAINYYNNKN